MSIQLDSNDSNSFAKCLTNGHHAMDREDPLLLSMESQDKLGSVSRLPTSTESTAYLIPSLNYFLRKYSVDSVGRESTLTPAISFRQDLGVPLRTAKPSDGESMRPLASHRSSLAPNESSAIITSLVNQDVRKQPIECVVEPQRSVNTSFLDLMKQAFTIENLRRQISKLRCHTSRARVRKSHKAPASPLLSVSSSRSNSKRNASCNKINTELGPVPIEEPVKADKRDKLQQDITKNEPNVKLKDKLRNNYILIKHRRLAEKFKNDYTISVINGRRLRKSKSFDGLFLVPSPVHSLDNEPTTPEPKTPGPSTRSTNRAYRPSIQLRHHSCVNKDMFLKISQMHSEDRQDEQLDKVFLSKIKDMSEVVPIELLAPVKKNGIIPGKRFISSFRNRFFSQIRKKRPPSEFFKNTSPEDKSVDFFNRLVKYNRLKSITSTLFLTHSLTSLSYESIDVDLKGSAYRDNSRKSTVKTVEPVACEPTPTNIQPLKSVPESASMLIRDDVSARSTVGFSQFPGSVSMSLREEHPEIISINSTNVKPCSSNHVEQDQMPDKSRHQRSMSKMIFKTFRLTTLKKPKANNTFSASSKPPQMNPRPSKSKFYSISKPRNTMKMNKIKRNASEILASGSGYQPIDLRSYEEKKAEINDKILNIYLNTCKYSCRRNAICSRIDKIYHNRQLINFMEYLLREDYIKNFLL